MVVVGCKLGEIATKRFTVPPKGKRVVHLDMLAEEFGRTTRAGARAVGRRARDHRRSARRLAPEQPAIKQRQVAYAADVAAAHGDLAGGRGRHLLRRKCRSSMARLMGELNQRLPADGILVADGGFAAHWGGLLFDTKRAGRGFVPDRGFASIGYGLPGAIGAALAAPGTAGRQPDRRRRLQHDAGRDGDRAPAGPDASRSSSSTTRRPATSRRCSI